jgi:hypothetical protein
VKLITQVAPEQTGVGFAITALAGVAPIVIPESREITSELAVKRYLDRKRILAKKEFFV